MASELKVYNQFRELILHIRLTSGDTPELLTIDATDEMRSAISSLIGQDFDRTVGGVRDLMRFSARWGAPEYARVLADYFANNFGWSTSLVETEQPLHYRTNATLGELFRQVLAPFESESNIKVDVGETNVKGVAVAPAAEANWVGLAGRNLPVTAQFGSGSLFDSVIAGITSQQSALGELQ
jgi:hypothetical protein